MNITWDADQNFEKSSLYHLHRGITTVKGRIGEVILTNNREPAKKWCVELFSCLALPNGWWGQAGKAGDLDSC